MGCDRSRRALGGVGLGGMAGRDQRDYVPSRGGARFRHQRAPGTRLGERRARIPRVAPFRDRAGVPWRMATGRGGRVSIPAGRGDETGGLLGRRQGPGATGGGGCLRAKTRGGLGALDWVAPQRGGNGAFAGRGGPGGGCRDLLASVSLGHRRGRLGRWRGLDRGGSDAASVPGPVTGTGELHSFGEGPRQLACLPPPRRAESGPVQHGFGLGPETRRGRALGRFPGCARPADPPRPARAAPVRVFQYERAVGRHGGVLRRNARIHECRHRARRAVGGGRPTRGEVHGGPARPSRAERGALPDTGGSRRGRRGRLAAKRRSLPLARVLRGASARGGRSGVRPIHLLEQSLHAPHEHQPDSSGDHGARSSRHAARFLERDRAGRSGVRRRGVRREDEASWQPGLPPGGGEVVHDPVSPVPSARGARGGAAGEQGEFAQSREPADVPRSRTAGSPNAPGGCLPQRRARAETPGVGARGRRPARPPQRGTRGPAAGT